MFYATVRAKTASQSMLVKTAIAADGIAQARQMLTVLYGEGNVLSLSQSLNETDVTKVLTADQLRLKNMADQKARITQNEKRERARQKLVKAQQTVQKANDTTIAVKERSCSP